MLAFTPTVVSYVTSPSNLLNLRFAFIASTCGAKFFQFYDSVVIRRARMAHEIVCSMDSSHKRAVSALCRLRSASESQGYYDFHLYW